MKCELISCLGTDLTVVNSARVSFENESRWARDIPALGITELSDRDKKLIKYLAKHQHFTPFTHCVITVREEVPIFVARQRFKHTIGFSYNEVSRRYVDSDPVFYHPDEWRRRAENKKQGSEDAGVSSQQLVSKAYDEFLIEAKEIYDDLLSMEVAPEQARMVLPQSMYTSYYVTGSLSAFARAYKLRIDDHAQKEIQYLAKMWNEIIEPLYPVSWAALIGETNA
jgi:thymidylate synthase (FAD)